MKSKLELYLKNIAKGKKQGFIPSLVKGVLLPLSWVYGWGVRFRNNLYERGWMRRYVPPVPLVISVGNIVAGGTGKTPVTLLLAAAFYDRYAVAILSRGYRSQAEKLDAPVVLCEGQGPTFPASYCGDEPYLFAKRLPKSLVIVGGDRKKASLIAAKAGSQVIILDDAMQHRRLVRDFDIAVVDAGDPFGQGYFLPRGFLRDDITSLQRAHLIILNNLSDQEQFSIMQEQLKTYTHAHMVGTKGYVEAIRDLRGQEVKISVGQSVGMFCAIAHPEYFKATLEGVGLNVVNEFALADHEQFDKKDLEDFARASSKKGAKWLLCTEKDRVKLDEGLKLPLPILWVQLELRILAGQEEWENFLQKAEKQLQNSK